jgi:glycosyltransferase involved in cell wall biosynthesis
VTAKRRARVSLVATVLNERGQIQEWMTAIDGQTVKPDEIIVVDGGSCDGTFETLLTWESSVPLSVVRSDGAGISRGRNAAIARATGEIIAVTDAGSVADATWLENLVNALETDCADVAAGFFVPIVNTVWDAALAATTLPRAGEINPSTFLPSSRSLAFRRTWFAGGIRYPEWLDYCEDVVFDLMLHRAGARFVFVPTATVGFHVRPNVRQFFLQYYRYARGDGKAGLFAKRHAVRYVTYVGLAIVLRRRRPIEGAIAVLLGAAYVARPVERFVRDRRATIPERRARLAGLVLIPPLRLTGDLAKIAGYPAGLVWRGRRFGRSSVRASWRALAPLESLL